MSWKHYLAAASLVVVFSLTLLACKTGPKAQPQARPGSVQLDPAQSKKLRLRATQYLQALSTQDFDTMWSMLEPESQQRLGIGKFVRQNGFGNLGTFMGHQIVSVEGVTQEKAVVKSNVRFQYFGHIFHQPAPIPVVFNWEDEWMLQPDGEWYRRVPPPDPEKIKQKEALCSAKRQG